MIETFLKSILKFFFNLNLIIIENKFFEIMMQVPNSGSFLVLSN